MRAFVFFAAMFTLAAAPAWAEAPTRLERAFFGGESARSPDLSRLVFWADLLGREGAGGKEDGAKRGPAPQTGDALALLTQVNSAVNAAPYVSDSDNWGQADYWQTSRELASRGGDCEDYAAAKYFALRAAGVPAEAMRIALVADETTRQRHAVLLVALEQGVFVLDNLSDEVLPAAAAAHYRPLLAMNERDWLMASEELRRAPAGELRSAVLPPPPQRRSWLARLFSGR